MRIEAVQLENIRSHVRSTVTFSRGFNCLVGGLGCGKSSILYAIDFALFGEPLSRSYEYLLRENANTGKITLNFIQDRKSYKIFRGLEKHAKGITQAFDELKLFQDETLIASGKADAVTEQLKAITGLDRELFREIVWVRQEHLKELLDVTPRERQKRLDKLFGLSDYEKAWSIIAEYQREFDGEKKAYEKDPDIVGMEKLNEEYNNTAYEFSLLEVELQNTSEKLDKTKNALETADSKLRELEEVKNLTEEFKQKEAQKQANLTNLKSMSASLVDKIDGEKLAIENLKKRLDTMENQIESCWSKLKEIGVPPDQSIETLNQHIEAFDDQISSMKGEREATLKYAQTDEQRVSSLSSESRCPVCLQPLTKKYKDNLTRNIREQAVGREESINQLQHDIRELQRIRNIANTAFSNLQTLVPRTEEVKKRIDQESQRLARLLKEFDEKKVQKGKLQEQLETLREGIKKFDVSKLQATRDERESVFRQYYLLKSQLETKRSRKKDLIKRLDEIKERIDQAQERIERMEKIDKAVEAIRNIRDAYRSIQPKLRSEFVRVLRKFVQQVLDSLIAGHGPLMSVFIDESYTPSVESESGVEREVLNLSGGERTLLAFAYRLGLGQLIMQSRTGRGLSMVLLDEPTESLGSEDGSIYRLAEAISRLKAIEQTIAVTHSEAFAEKAEHVIRLEKEAGVSRVPVEK